MAAGALKNVDEEEIRSRMLAFEAIDLLSTIMNISTKKDKSILDEIELYKDEIFGTFKPLILLENDLRRSTLVS